MNTAEQGRHGSAARSWLRMGWVLAVCCQATPARAQEPTGAPVAAAADATPATADPTSPLGVAQTQWSSAPSPAAGMALLQAYAQAGRMAQARLLAETLTQRYPESAVVRAELGYFWYMANEFKRAYGEFLLALRAPEWDASQRRNLQTALANSAQAAGDLPAAMAALRPLCEGPDQVGGLLRMGRLQLAAKDRRGALATARRVAGLASAPAQRWEAADIEKAALIPIEEPRTFRMLTGGYGFLRMGEDAQGLAAFEKAFAMGAGKAFHYADAAYAAKRLGYNAKAVDYFVFALDMDQREHAFAPQQQYGYRREIEVMERRFGLLLGSPYHAGTLNVWQLAAEAFWQPEALGNRNGRILQVVGRVFGNARNGVAGATGWPTAQAAAGVRYKPLESQNLMLTAEGLVALGSAAVNDALLRVGYSAGGGLDLQVEQRWWQSWHIFAESGYYVRAQRAVAGLEARYGAVVVPPGLSRLTVLPHALLAGEWDTAASPQGAVAVGPGVILRAWLAEDRYRAPRGWFEVQASYRWSNTVRGQGPVVRATLSL